jgi:hypothetical protein
MATFTIGKKDWNKIINYARARYASEKDEIGGMAVVNPVPNEDTYLISHPTILKQETSGGNCVLDKEALAAYYVDMALKHGNDVQFMWWHSHGDMKAFWSGTDTSTMDEYASGTWSVFLVVNIKEEYKFRIMAWQPQQMYIDTDLEILGVTEKKIPDSITKEVEEQCSTRVWSTGKPVKKGVQTSLYSDADDFGIYGGYNGYTDIMYPHTDQTLTAYNGRSWACSAVDELNDGYMDGTLPYKDYVQAISDLNGELVKVKSTIRVHCESEGMLFHAAQHKYPYQFLEDIAAKETQWQLT